MVQRYDTLYGFNRYHPNTNPPTETQLLATLEALENERHVLIAQRRDEAQRNREAKLARKNGQRARDTNSLYTALLQSWLGSTDAEVPCAGE